MQQLTKLDHYYNDAIFEEDWFTYPNLYSNMVGFFPSNSHFVEVGSWKGRSSAFMAVEINNSGKNIKFDCVDTWRGSGNEDCHNLDSYVKAGTLYEKFLSNIEPVKHIITPKRGDSVEIAKTYTDKSLDFVFIDGDHRYKFVKADILAWLPKVKSGGILAGHDYALDDVNRAVHEVFGTQVNLYYMRENCWVVIIN